jgi:hypothetical protein
VLAPLAKASSPDAIVIPSDIPTSGNQQLDLLIFSRRRTRGCRSKIYSCRDLARIEV